MSKWAHAEEHDAEPPLFRLVLTKADDLVNFQRAILHAMSVEERQARSKGFAKPRAGTPIRFNFVGTGTSYFCSRTNDYGTHPHD